MVCAESGLLCFYYTSECPHLATENDMVMAKLFRSRYCTLCCQVSELKKRIKQYANWVHLLDKILNIILHENDLSNSRRVIHAVLCLLVFFSVFPDKAVRTSVFSWFFPMRVNGVVIWVERSRALNWTKNRDLFPLDRRILLPVIVDVSDSHFPIQIKCENN